MLEAIKKSFVFNENRRWKIYRNHIAVTGYLVKDIDHGNNPFVNGAEKSPDRVNS